MVASSGDPTVPENTPGDVYVWDGTSGELLMTLPREHTRTVNSVDISPDGLSLLTASDDNTLILWDLASGQVLKRFAGHTDDVNIGLFSPNPERPFILSASDDASIIMWDITTGLPLRRFLGHTAPITGLNISPNGQRMISSTGGDTMIIWRIETPQQVIDWTLANRYVRAFSPDECAQYSVPNCNAGSTQVINQPVATLPAQPTLAQQPVEQATLAQQPVEQPTLIPPSTAPTQVFVVNTGVQGVNVRSSDSTQAAAIGVLNAGERVQAIGISSQRAPVGTRSCWRMGVWPGCPVRLSALKVTRPACRRSRRPPAPHRRPRSRLQPPSSDRAAAAKAIRPKRPKPVATIAAPSN